MEKQKLVVICGPTASGKTALAVDVARRFGGEVVSADSMQVYRGMDIGTAKPTERERGGVPHHMLDCAEPGEEYGAAVYREQARACISDISCRGKLPILCGGTGLYISATVYPLDFSNAEADEEFRAELQEFVKTKGSEALHGWLVALDPDAARAIHPNNVRRVIRALEKARTTGSSSSAPPESNQLFNGKPLYDMAWIGLTMDRENLYRRIEARVDEMMARGLPDEVRMLTSALGPRSTALQAIGYKELLRYFNGEITEEQAVELIKVGTRNYAKRQLTWFRRERAIRWFDTAASGSREALDETVSGYIRETLHIN